MKAKHLIFNTIYIADNNQFSSISKQAVEKWERNGLNISSLSHAERNLWACRGELREYKR